MGRILHRGNVAPVVFAGVLLSALWAYTESSDAFYVPALREVLGTVWDSWLTGPGRDDILISLRRVVIGLVISAVLGISIGILLGMYPRLRRAVNPLVEFFRAMPPPALVPFGLVFFGIGDSGKIFVIVLASVWPILLNTLDGVTQVDPSYREAAQTYKFGSGARLRFVLLPSVAPQVVAGISTAVQFALVVTVISEMVGSADGIGFTILRAQRTYDMPGMWSGVVILGLIGITLNALITFGERRILRWYHGWRQIDVSA